MKKTIISITILLSVGILSSFEKKTDVDYSISTNDTIGMSDSNGNYQVCHRIVTRGKALYQTLTVAPSQVAAHLQHGDAIGKCPITP